VDPSAHYGLNGELPNSESDAKAMCDLAQSCGFAAATLLTASATASNLIREIQNARSLLEPGDLFFLSFSGHGGQLADYPPDDPPEPDKKDETWWLFDREYRDDDINIELGNFKEGVRILVISDSCHSGSVIKNPAVQYATSNKHYCRRNGAQWRAPKKQDTPILDPAISFKPSAILLSASDDAGVANTDPKERNSVFTKAVMDVWNNGAFKGNYLRFHADIQEAIGTEQLPQIFTLGDTAAFINQQPFFI
jgi:hypothetical protein